MSSQSLFLAEKFVLARDVCSTGLLGMAHVVGNAARCMRSDSSSDGRRTLSDGSAGVSAVGASVLLDVKGAAACICIAISLCSRLMNFPVRWQSCNRPISFSLLFLILHIPQRRHRTCVLLWRLPNEEVPLAISFRQHVILLLQLYCSW